MAKTKNKLEESDFIAESIVQSINRDLKNSAFLLGAGNTPTDVSDFISTGSSLLDLIISNRIGGGFPVGRISIVNGLESVGKSLLAAHALASTQKKNGVAVLIDAEKSYDTNFLKAIGVNVDKLVYADLETIEDIFTCIEKTIIEVREKAPDKLVTIVVDSVAAASTKKEIEGTFDKEGYGTEKAMLISKGMRKLTQSIGRNKICLIFTNQLRMNMNATPFSDPWISPGGKALPFHSSVTIRLTKVGQVKEKESVVGVRVKAQVVKSRIAPPFRHCLFNIYFDRGIDDLEGWYDTLTDLGVISKQKGAQFSKLIIDSSYEKIGELKEFLETGYAVDTIKEITNDYIEFKNSHWNQLISTSTNKILKEYVYWQLAKNLILKYSSENIEREIEETGDGEVV